MSLEGIVVGALALAVGLGFAFYGFRLFLILLPIWGFLAGWTVGAGGIAYIFPNEGLLVSGLAIVTGFIVGIIFAVLSYLYYWVAVILLGGSMGYALTIGLLQWIGFTGDGWIAFILGLIVGAVFAIGFAVLHMPAVFVVVGTAILGAAASIAGVLLILGLVKPAEIQHGPLGVYQAHDLGVIWVIAAIVLAAVAAYYQVMAIGRLSESIRMDQYRNPGMTGTGTSGA